jgi:adenylyl- and sulfurtransferase ThiI
LYKITRVMITKLTLTLEDSIINRAKQYAKKSGRSLSDIIEAYLDGLTKKEDKLTEGMNDDLKKLFGVTQISPSLDHKKEIRKILTTKHK